MQLTRNKFIERKNIYKEIDRRRNKKKKIDMKQNNEKTQQN